MRRNTIAYPYIIWMVIFTIAPLLLIFYYSVVEAGNGFQITFKHIQRVFDPLYIAVLFRSVKLAAISTFVCLILGYPMAMILAQRNLSKKSIFVVLFVIPMWMNFLARTYAWMTLLQKNGPLNSVLSLMNLPQLNILYTESAVVLGMVYNFLPFMVLPIYSVLIKIDRSVVEAAEDLGATPYISFITIILPKSLPGIMSGIAMVFMPSVTTFVISSLLGGGQQTLIGNLIEQQFLKTRDWGFGSSLSLVLMILILLSMGIISKYEKEREGGGLW